MENLNELMSDAQYAIRHYESSDAKEISETIKSFLQTPDAKNIGFDISQKLEKLLIYLKIISIPSLSDEESADILRKNFLNSFDAEIDMENLLTTKLFFIPEIPRDKLREKLKRALMENQQRLGALTVGQWIQEFEKMFNVRTRSLSASVEFVAKHPQTAILNPLEKSRLKELLHTYDYLLVTTLPATGPVLENILAAIPDNFSPSKGQMYSTPTFRQSRQLAETMPFNSALQKYSAFGEQPITSEKIKLPGFPESVRPSVKNWIADYTSMFGYEKNNPIKRNDYLFRSPNGQSLDQSDRERLSFVLKAFEENATVSFNQDTKMLMFGKANALPAEPETSQSNISFVPASQEKETIPQGEMSFSFPQRMPFEKTSTPQPIQPTQPIQSAPSATPKINTNPNIVKIPPKIITPPKNVVNLKDLQ